MSTRRHFLKLSAAAAMAPAVVSAQGAGAGRLRNPRARERRGQYRRADGDAHHVRPVLLDRPMGSALAVKIGAATAAGTLADFSNQRFTKYDLKADQDLIEAVLAAASVGKPFDIVLMDVQMPVMGGHDATRELRKHFDAEQLPIVALTAAALVSERDDAFAAGMNDFLTKPIDTPKLHQTLLRLVSAKR